MGDDARADQVRCLSDLRGRLCRVDLPDRLALDLGRRLAHRTWDAGLRGLDGCPLAGRDGGARWDAPARTQDRQVRRDGPPTDHSRPQYAPCSAWGPDPLDRLVG